MPLLLDLYEMTHLAKHAREDRAVVVLDGLADLAEAERAQRAAVALALADLAADLRDADLRHLRVLLPAQDAAPRLLLLRRRSLGGRLGHSLGLRRRLRLGFG